MPGPRPRALPGWLDVLALSAIASALAAWGWGRWADAVVDFGREVYLPWQINEGRVLYRDLTYLYSPLSPYVNALIFRLFGAGLATLAFANLAVLGAVLLLTRGLLVDAAGRLAAFAGCLVALFASAFSHIGYLGNYNFIAPYSHAVTYGFLAAGGTLAFLAAYFRAGRPAALRASAFCAGIVFLLKQEYFLATACALVPALLLFERGRPGAARRAAEALAFFSIPAVVAFAAFATAMPPADALRAVLGGWPIAVSQGATGDPFFHLILGTSDFVANLLAWVVFGGGWLAFVAALSALSLASRRLPPRLGRAAPAAAFATVAGLALLGMETIPWADLPRPLPVFLLAAIAITARRLHRARGEARAREATRLVLLAFALGLTARMFFRLRTGHLGFGLALPALLFAGAVLLRAVPDWIGRRGGAPGVFRAGAMAAVVVFCFAHFLGTKAVHQAKSGTVGQGLDRLHVFELQSETFANALKAIGQAVPPRATLAVLPEGVLLNFLSGRPNPTPYENFVPVTLGMFGEGRVVEALRRNPPDYLLFLFRETAEFGKWHFGVDYGLQLKDWIRANYELAVSIGDDPLTSISPGVRLLRRRPGAG